MHNGLRRKWYIKQLTDNMGAVMERQVVEERLAKMRQEGGEWKGKLLVPSRGVLARTLIDRWLEIE